MFKECSICGYEKNCQLENSERKDINTLKDSFLINEIELKSRKKESSLIGRVSRGELTIILAAKICINYRAFLENKYNIFLNEKDLKNNIDN